MDELANRRRNNLTQRLERLSEDIDRIMATLAGLAERSANIRASIRRSRLRALEPRDDGGKGPGFPPTPQPD